MQYMEHQAEEEPESNIEQSKRDKVEEWKLP